MSSKASVTKQDFEKLEKRLKLDSLEAEKKFVDLQLSVGKLEEKVKEMAESVPKLKEGSDNLDSLVHVVTLGIRDFKKATDDLGGRISSVETLPKKVDSTLSNYSEKLQAMEGEITKVSAELKNLSTLKDDISKNIESTILPSINAIRETGERNRLQVGDMKKDVDNFSALIKSFQRTLELTDIESVIRRFDTINSKIMNTEMQIENLKSHIPDMSIVDKELEIIKTRVQEVGGAVVERNARMNELETSINIIKNKLKELNFFETVNEMRADLKEKEKNILITQMKMDDFGAKFDKLSDELGVKVSTLENTMKKTKHLDLIENVSRDVQRQVANLDDTRSTVERLSEKVERMYLDVVKRASGVEGVNNELKKIKTSVFELQRIVDDNRMKVSQLEEEGIIKAVSDGESKLKLFNKNLGMLYEKFNNLEGEWEEIWKRIKSLEGKADDTRVDELEKFVGDLKGRFDVQRKITSGVQDVMSNMKNRVDATEKTKDIDYEKLMKLEKTVSGLEGKINVLDKDLQTTIPKIEKPAKTDDLRKTVDTLQKIIISHEKSLAVQRETLDRMIVELSHRPSQAPKIPQHVEDEISSLRKIINALSQENEELRVTVNELKSSESVPTHLLSELLTRIDMLEERFQKIERKLREEMIVQPVILE